MFTSAKIMHSLDKTSITRKMVKVNFTLGNICDFHLLLLLYLPLLPLKFQPNTLFMSSSPPSPRPKWPRPNDLPLPRSYAAQLILIITAHIPILINIPTLTRTCTSIIVLGSILERALRFFPFALALTLALHLTLK